MCPGLSFLRQCSGGYRTKRKLLRWSVGHGAPCGRRRDKSWPVVREPWRVGALTYSSKRASNGIQVDQGVARKAKQKPEGDGRNENDSSVGSALNVPPDNVIGVVKVGPSVIGSGGSGRLVIRPH